MNLIFNFFFLKNNLFLDKNVIFHLIYLHFLNKKGLFLHENKNSIFVQIRPKHGWSDENINLNRNIDTWILKIIKEKHDKRVAPTSNNQSSNTFHWASKNWLKPYRREKFHSFQLLEKKSCSMTYIGA